MSSSPFPSFPISRITIPSTPLTISAHAYITRHKTPTTVTHVLRSTAFALLLIHKLPPLSSATVDTELVVLSTILHDLGWSHTKSLISPDKRFEVDGANAARTFIQSTSSSTKSGDKEEWDNHRLQLLWDAIALHTTPSIAHHKEPEVFATQLGISADFFGPNIPTPIPTITVEEYKEIVSAFPRLGFKDELVGTMCGLCREKKETTFDNFVSSFGKVYGLDGKGGGKEEWQEEGETNDLGGLLVGGLESCEQWDQ